MNLTSFELSLIINELKETLINQRVDKIYNIPKDMFRIKFRKRYLEIQLPDYIRLTETSVTTPMLPSTLAMTLRKHLTSGIITDIRQHKADKVIIIDISTKRGDLHLIIELFGEGNFILTNSDYKIITTYHFQQWKDRKIRPKYDYILPEFKYDKFVTTEDELTEMLSTKFIASTLSHLPIGKKYTNEILQTLNINETTEGIALTNKQIKQIVDQINHTVNNCKPYYNPTTNVFSIRQQEGFDEVVSFNKAFELINPTQNNILCKKVVPKEDKDLKKLKKRLSKQNEHLDKLITISKQCNRIGDVIYEHYNEIQSLLEKAKKGDPLPPNVKQGKDKRKLKIKLNDDII